MENDFVPFTESNEELNESISEVIESQPKLLTTVPAPWLINLDQFDRNVPPLVRLHNEILSFCEYVSPSQEELTLRDSVVQEISVIVKNIWPNASVQVFGSQMTRIITPTSDIDLAILNVPTDTADVQDCLSKLAAEIRNCGKASYVEAILNAKVPIVKLDHIRSNIAVDVCINNDSGLRTGRLIRRYVRMYPPLRPLTILLKIFLAQRRLNDTYSGGIGSFVLCAMIISYLQMKQRLSLYSNLEINWNLGALLIEFLHLYGNTFNYYECGISIANRGQYFNKRKREDGEYSQHRPNMLCIENPDTPELDMGKNSFQLPKIRRAFDHAHQLLVTAIGLENIQSYLSYFIRTDDASLTGRSGLELLSTVKLNSEAIK